MRPLAESRKLTLIHEPVLECTPEITKRREVHVIAELLARQRNVRGMVKIVIPLRGEAEPAFLRPPHHPGTVEIALGDGTAAGSGRQLLQEGQGGVVVEGMNG